ncbi:MAG: transglutaminase-like domain-containing protein [Actinomycetota bacterium]
MSTGSDSIRRIDSKRRSKVEKRRTVIRLSRARLPLGFTAVTILMLWLTTLVASAALWPIYQSLQLVGLVASTVLVGTAIAFSGALYRWSTLTLTLVTIGVYLLLGVPVAIPDRALYGVLPTVGGELELLRATALSWKQLLTITLPVGSYQSLLVPAFILVLVSTVVGASVGLRARWGELGVLAPIALFVTAILFGAATATWPLELALGLLASALAWLGWRRWYRRRASIRVLATQAPDSGGRPLETAGSTAFAGIRTVLRTGLIVVLAASGAVAATTALPPTVQRNVLRTAVVKPFDPRAYASPLSGFRRYEATLKANTTMLTVTGLPIGGRIRIATLDTYDGIVYSVGSALVSSESGSFTRVPSTFDQSSTAGSPVTLRVSIDDYSGIWLPTVGKFTSVAFSGADASGLRDSFFYNDTSGTAAVLKPLQSGDSYTLEAVDPRQPSADQLASLRPGTAEVPRTAELPDQLSATLDQWTRSQTSAGARLTAMISAMKQTGYVSHGVDPEQPPSRSGHAADRITQLLTDQRMIGDQEQYAVTAALMARQLGFAARVVFGFVPEVNTQGPTQVLGKDVSAWIEVDTAQYGWVTIDPTPPEREIPAAVPQEPTRVARPQPPVQPPVETPPRPTTQLPPDSTQDPPTADNPLLAVLLTVLQVLGWVAVGAAVILAPFLAVVAAKVRRRMLRRRAPTALQRISGGWQEFEDAVVDHGFDPPASPTRTEVASTVGGVPALVLAAVADRAVFSPDEPRDGEADQVWRAVTDLRESMSDGRTRRQRIRAAISLRSLGGYSVKRLFRR